MTIKAAQTLDQAFATYLSVAGHDDSDPVSRQSPSWYPLTEAPRWAPMAPSGETRPATKYTSTPYDFAAALVKSLLPYAYNYDPSLSQITERIWEEMLSCCEVIAFDHPFMKEVLMDKNTREPYLCDTCGYDEKSIQHYKECADVTQAHTTA